MLEPDEPPDSGIKVCVNSNGDDYVSIDGKTLNPGELFEEIRRYDYKTNPNLNGVSFFEKVFGGNVISEGEYGKYASALDLLIQERVKLSRDKRLGKAY